VWFLTTRIGSIQAGRLSSMKRAPSSRRHSALSVSLSSSPEPHYFCSTSSPLQWFGPSRKKPFGGPCEASSGLRSLSLHSASSNFGVHSLCDIWRLDPSPDYAPDLRSCANLPV